MKAKKYFGKYRGTVLINEDPQKRARIIAEVPAVSSLLPTTWCEPCLPLAGIQSGTYFVPAVGAGVWIEYEQGDVRRPIWTGCFWGSLAEVPRLALAGVPASPSIVLQTTGQNTMMISDAIGILLQSLSPAVSVSIFQAGIVLKNGSASISILPNAITITNGTAIITIGPGTAVAVNGDGLIVT